MKKLLLFIFSVIALTANAQKVQVDECLDSIEITLGQQCHLFLTVTARDNADIQVPDFADHHHITPGVEVLEIAKADSIILDDGAMRQTIVYTITSFEPKLQYLPPLTVLVDGKKYSGKKLALKVLDVPVDTTNYDKFYPSKDIQTNPFMWSEWIPLIVLYAFASLLAVIAMLSWLIRKSNKPIKISFRIIKRVPAHVKAMNAIDDIKAKHLTVSDDQKYYYTQLTDTLRHYIQERFGFSAMEMTTSEIIERLNTEDPKKVSELREVFEIADLVKFAKYSTLVNENDRNLVSAIDFINSTKTEEIVEEHKEQEQPTSEQKQSTLARKILTCGIYACVVGISALLAYILWQVVMLIE